MQALTPLDTVLDHLKQIADETRNSDGDVKCKRALVDRYFAAHPSCLESNADCTTVEGPGFSGVWVTADGSDPGMRLLYIHGGSWMAGSPKGYQGHAARISQVTRCSVLLIDYPLTPESPFPEGLNSCVDAFKWMANNGPDGESPARSRCIAGDSAGGNLALASLLKLKAENEILPQAAVVLSPATDLAFATDSMHSKKPEDPVINPDFMPFITRLYLGDEALVDNPLASPLRGDLEGLPPLLIQTGSAEVLLDDSTAFARKAISQGSHVEIEIWPRMPHVFQGFAPFLPEAVKALERISQFTAHYL